MPGRRPLLALVACYAISLQACLHVSSTPSTSTPAPEPTTKITAKAPVEVETSTNTATRKDFAILPKVPGAVMPKTPSGNSAAMKTVPILTNPPGGVQTASGEPQPFPPFTPPPEPPLLAAVRAYIESRPDQAIEIIRTMDKNNQDFVLAVLPILARGASADLMNDQITTAALVEQLRGAIARLEPRAALKIEKFVFCSKVDGFGRYTPRSMAEPYKPNDRVNLYLELRNLSNQITSDGYRVHVRAEVEIRDAKENLVPQFQSTEQRVPVVRFEQDLVTRSPLSDFHVLYGFAAPAVPGVYTVTVKLSDATGRRVVKSQPAEFRVAGP
ncbi:Uncharacterized protein OS=Planctomyces maris DSM 8797 GN=PM8797T_06987 PE=4 SV=1 [Gemmata massiliana]|uniref:Uncharacterized protein n=1 Tax=Gemmata massiliana TaxID=1210884 RepID=A0A6P2DA31_9BACT|nr:hypothetical protein [Gemmata massiliana]VTR97416.1 Uncharacterized protein OS=Planctomyces maris DSM 8797 GN=PM8797T_06987 PE=4 SV=1 [Gemmata massiliana]